MATTRALVSPGVFTNEIDVSFLGQGVGAIGAALIGTAVQGPAFVPMRVSNFGQFSQFFGTGSLDPSYPLGYAARAYLKNSATANVVRVLGPAGRTANGQAITPGYSADSTWAITAATGTVGATVALLELTSSQTLIINDLTNDQFDIRISGSSFADSTGYVLAVTASMLTGSTNYIKNVLNTDPTKYTSYGYFLRTTYDYAMKLFNNGAATYASQSVNFLNGRTFGFNSASSPFVKSQEFGGSTEYNLFRVHTLGHGKAENGRFKVSIENVKSAVNPSVSQYGTFNLVVREFGDQDDSLGVVESYENLNLNPADANYILRRIGDKYWAYDQTKRKMVSYGNFSNNSSYIRIELATASFPQLALPWGFRGFARPDITMTLSGGIVVSSSIAPLPYVADLKDKETQAEAQDGIYWGVEFQLSGNVASRFSLLPTLTGSDPDFSLKNVSGSIVSNLVYNVSNPTASKKAPGDTLSSTVLSPTYAKFTMPLGFGFDGFDVRLSNPLDNESQLASVTQLGTQAVRQAVDIIGDPDFIDINLLAIPGIYANTVTKYAINSVENRADAFYIMDVSGSSVSTIVANVRGNNFDTNYAGVYYPPVKVLDDVNNLIVQVPASIMALGAMAYNDRVSFQWFAPAGLNRGGLNSNVVGFTVTEAVDRLTADERDTLYENRINPIASFPAEGLAIWGQKTLQAQASALDRINVRRLLIQAKKLVASALKFVVFEPNNPATRSKITNIINPILKDIQTNNGLTAFQVVFDETINTPDLIDRNILAGKIVLVPTRTAEFITVDFVIDKSGVSFNQ